MKLFVKILFWTYFTIASVAFVAVVIYLISHYRPFAREFKYKTQQKDFSMYFFLHERTDSRFTSLFNTNADPAIDFLNRAESYFVHTNYKSKAVDINAIDLANLDSLFRNWPVKYRDIIKENLLGIFIVDTARFNGLTQIIPSTDDRFIVYLNAKLFKQAPNAWISNECTKGLKKEFRSKVKYEMFSDSDNIPIKTVEHVLIHEFSHIISFLYHEAPLPDGSFNDKQGYFPLIESCFDSGNISYEAIKPSFSKFSVLSNSGSDESEKLDFDEFRKLTKELPLSPFPTPYSTANAIELVAESLTLYIHQHYQKNKFIVIFDNSDTTYFAQKIDTTYIKNILKILDNKSDSVIANGNTQLFLIGSNVETDDYIKQFPANQNAVLRLHIERLRKEWQNAPNPLTATYQGNDFGDYHHILFKAANGVEYDFGQAKNNYGQYQLHELSGQYDDNPKFLGKKFKVYWDWKLSEFLCCEGEYGEAKAYLPSITKLELIKN